MQEVRITPATRPEDIAAVRTLCWAYRDFLLAQSDRDRQITETFYPVPKYRDLMAALPEIHAAPEGIMLLAKDAQDIPLGCGMLQPILGDSAEIKRVYVTDAARGRGVARSLCTALVAHARAQGHARVLLDTSTSLTAAQSLYARLGFTRRGPYQPIPDSVLPDLLFYELTL